VRLAASDGLKALLEDERRDLPALLIVSQVELVPELDEAYASALLEGLRIAVERARGAKCERCWNYREDVGSDAEHPGICGRCAHAVRQSPAAS